MSDRTADGSWDRLGTRQRKVLLLVCRGLRNAEIAQELSVSERTVKAYIGQLFLVFNVSNRTELAVLALEGISPAATGLLPTRISGMGSTGVGQSRSTS